METLQKIHERLVHLIKSLLKQCSRACMYIQTVHVCCKCFSCFYWQKDCKRIEERVTVCHFSSNLSLQANTVHWSTLWTFNFRLTVEDTDQICLIQDHWSLISFSWSLSIYLQKEDCGFCPPLFTLNLFQEGIYFSSLYGQEELSQTNAPFGIHEDRWFL